MNRKKQIRAAFRMAVFERDGYRCAMCGRPGKDRQGGSGHEQHHLALSYETLVLLDTHHITDRNEMPNGGYVLDNGISLCDESCHALAELFHETGTAHPGFAPADLYTRIGSSYENAWLSSSMANAGE